MRVHVIINVPRIYVISFFIGVLLKGGHLLAITGFPAAQAGHCGIYEHSPGSQVCVPGEKLGATN